MTTPGNDHYPGQVENIVPLQPEDWATITGIFMETPKRGLVRGDASEDDPMIGVETFVSAVMQDGMSDQLSSDGLNHDQARLSALNAVRAIVAYRQFVRSGGLNPELHHPAQNETVVPLLEDDWIRIAEIFMRPPKRGLVRGDASEDDPMIGVETFVSAVMQDGMSDDLSSDGLNHDQARLAALNTVRAVVAYREFERTRDTGPEPPAVH